MINLLPDIEKKLVLKEYRFRLGIVILLFVLLLTTLMGILLVPSFVLSLYRKDAASKRAEANIKPQTEEIKKLLDELRAIEVNMTMLAPATTTTPTNILSVIIKNRTAENTVTDMTYTLNEKKEVMVAVRGVARNRNSLLSFTTALEREPLITKIDVPVSNFAKNTNINYAFTVYSNP